MCECVKVSVPVYVWPEGVVGGAGAGGRRKAAYKVESSFLGIFYFFPQRLMCPVLTIQLLGMKIPARFHQMYVGDPCPLKTGFGKTLFPPGSDCR